MISWWKSNTKSRSNAAKEIIAPSAPGGSASSIAEPPTPPKPDSEAVAQQMRAARQSGYQDGYRDGLVALDSFKESFALQVGGQVTQVLASLDRELGQLEQQLAAGVARVATELARQVVRSELGLRPALVVRVAQEAVDAVLMSARHITVQVHPDKRKGSLMGFLGFLLLGLIAGAIAKAILPGRQGGGWFITLLLGVVGALLGGWLGGLLFNVSLGEFFSLTTWLLAIVGSLVVLLIYGLITNRRKAS